VIRRYIYGPIILKSHLNIQQTSVLAISVLSSTMALQGKTAFIAGGGKNLGALVAAQLAAEGSNLALHYHSPSAKEGAETLVADLTQKHPGIKIKLYQADLVVAKNVQEVFASVLEDFGKIDIVVNTTGMVLKKALIDISEEEYDRMFAVNSKAAFFITQEAAKAISDGGKIVNIVTALLAAYTPFYTAYQGSKAPVEWFTKGLSKELMSRGISVNAIAPGPMDTPFFYAQETDDSVVYLKSGAMDNRLTKIEDIAPLVKFLVTDDGRWITGQFSEFASSARANFNKVRHCSRLEGSPLAEKIDELSRA
jgi:NAD(P)-dependent dehydrogenase (short-subunit alcohol dehydrogenase family)